MLWRAMNGPAAAHPAGVLDGIPSPSSRVIIPLCQAVTAYLASWILPWVFSFYISSPQVNSSWNKNSLAHQSIDISNGATTTPPSCCFVVTRRPLCRPDVVGLAVHILLSTTPRRKNDSPWPKLELHHELTATPTLANCQNQTAYVVVCPWKRRGQIARCRSSFIVKCVLNYARAAQLYSFWNDDWPSNVSIKSDWWRWYWSRSTKFTAT